MKIRIAFLVLALLLISILGGCTDSGESADEGGQTTTETEEAAESTPESSEADYSDVLTPADVEAVTGMTGLVVMEPDPTVGAGGEVNIADADGLLVVMVDAGTGLWDAWQSDGMTVDRPSDPTVGDESFLGPKDAADDDVYILGFRKGETDAAVVAFFNVDFTRTLTLDQMYELAEIVESRL